MEKKELEDFKKRILKKIEESGYPYELKATEFFKNFGYYVANNVYYIDKDENKGREIDLRALKNYIIEGQNKKYYIRHSLLIECKKSKNPWVVFTNEWTPYDMSLSELPRSGISDDWICEKNINKLTKIHPFTTRKLMRGRSYVDPFSGNNERIYKALVSVAKATIATKLDSMRYLEVCFHYPIILFDGLLYEAYLNKDKITVDQVDMVIVSFFYQSPKYPDVKLAIPIITWNALHDFISDLDSVLDFFGELIEQNQNLFITK